MTTTTFFIIFIPILSILLLSINLVLAPHNPYQEKDSVFECGFHSFLGQNRTQFSISFFIFGLLFLLFDLEILLVYPYSVSAYNNDIYGLVIMMIFFILLTLGFVFELGKNALSIESKQNFSYKMEETRAVFILTSGFHFSICWFVMAFWCTEWYGVIWISGPLSLYLKNSYRDFQLTKPYVDLRCFMSLMQRLWLEYITVERVVFCFTIICIKIFLLNTCGIDILFFPISIYIEAPLLSTNFLCSCISNLKDIYLKDKSKFFILLIFTVFLYFIITTGIIGICYFLAGEELANLVSISVFKLIVKEFSLEYRVLGIKSAVGVLFRELLCGIKFFTFNTLNFINLNWVLDYIDFSSLKAGLVTILKSLPLTRQVVNVIELYSSKPNINRTSAFRHPFRDFTIHKVITSMKTRLSVYVPMDYTFVKNVTQQVEVTLIYNNNTSRAGFLEFYSKDLAVPDFTPYCNIPNCLEYNTGMKQIGFCDDSSFFAENSFFEIKGSSYSLTTKSSHIERQKIWDLSDPSYTNYNSDLEVYMESTTNHGNSNLDDGNDENSEIWLKPKASYTDNELRTLARYEYETSPLMEFPSASSSVEALPMIEPKAIMEPQDINISETKALIKKRVSLLWKKATDLKLTYEKYKGCIENIPFKIDTTHYDPEHGLGDLVSLRKKGWDVKELDIFDRYTFIHMLANFCKSLMYGLHRLDGETRANYLRVINPLSDDYRRLKGLSDDTFDFVGPLRKELNHHINSMKAHNKAIMYLENRLYEIMRVKKDSPLWNNLDKWAFNDMLILRGNWDKVNYEIDEYIDF
jgi:NADH-ubiquinone oxidoreductase chain 3